MKLYIVEREGANQPVPILHCECESVEAFKVWVKRNGVKYKAYYLLDNVNYNAYTSHKMREDAIAWAVVDGITMDKKVNFRQRV